MADLNHLRRDLFSLVGLDRDVLDMDMVDIGTVVMDDEAPFLF